MGFDETCKQAEKSRVSAEHARRVADSLQALAAEAWVGSRGQAIPPPSAPLPSLPVHSVAGFRWGQAPPCRLKFPV